MISIRKQGRFFGLYEQDELIALCVYKKGAEEIKRRLEDGHQPGNHANATAPP